MTKTPIRDLPIKCNKEYILTVKKIIGSSSMVVAIDGRSYYISIPYNLSWQGQEVFVGMNCVITKEYYTDRAYAKLNLIRTYNNDYKYKNEQTTTYSSINKYYELLECSIDATFEDIKKNYRKLIRQYHYDTLASKDLPQDMMLYGENKSKMLNEAYEKLKNRY